MQAPGGNLNRGWTSKWSQNSFLFILEAADLQLQARERIEQHAVPKAEVKIGWQSRAENMLNFKPRGMALLHLRRRLDRWKLHTLPGHRPRRIERLLHSLSKLAQPRVLAAVLRIVCNGWCTGRRFQRSDACKFGCKSGLDSNEHYARCPRLQQCFNRHLNIPAPERGFELDEFLCMRVYNARLPPAALASAIMARAVACYAAYRTHNGIRCGRISQELWEGAFLTYVREGLHVANPRDG